MTPKTHQEQPMSDSGVIRVRGARTNNLRDIDVDIRWAIALGSEKALEQ